MAGGKGRVRGVEGGRSGRADSAVTGLNYRESGEHREEFPKEYCHPNRLIPTFTGLFSRPTASPPIKVIAKGEGGRGDDTGGGGGDAARRKRWRRKEEGKNELLVVCVCALRK